MLRQRSHFPKHSKLYEPDGSAPFAIDVYDLLVDMGQLRKVLVLKKNTFTVRRVISKETFWDGVLASCAEATSRQTVSSPYLSAKLSSLCPI